MGSLLIRNGRVIDPASGLDGVRDVAVVDGRIAEIKSQLSPSSADEVVDAAGMIVSPGLIDPHVHLRQPGQSDRETIQTGSAAAAAGGFTAVVCMPNTSPAIDTPETVAWVIDQAKERARCRVFTTGAVTVGRRGEALTDIASLAKAGAVAFTDDGDVVARETLMARALEEIARTGRPLMQHCQEPTMTRGASMNAGSVATRLGLVGWPNIAEEVIIERDIALNRSAHCKYHVQHLSSAGSVEIIRKARSEPAMGDLISAEASPHHLILTEDSCDGFNTLAKMNPPVRSAADRNAIRRGVADGVITVLATDHAPHTSESKATDFAAASFGITGLETALPLYVEALVTTGAIDWPRLIELMTINPARLCGLDAVGLGKLAVGGAADITVIDPDYRWVYRVEESKSKARNSPFDSRNLLGRAVLTVSEGVIQHRIERESAAGV